MNEVGSDAAARLRQQGWCVVPDVLSATRAAEVRERLWQAAELSRARGVDTHVPALDPNDCNVRVFNLLDLDPVFRELIASPTCTSATAIIRVAGEILHCRNNDGEVRN